MAANLLLRPLQGSGAEIATLETISKPPPRVASPLVTPGLKRKLVQANETAVPMDAARPHPATGALR